MSDFKFTGSFAEVYDRCLVPMDFVPHGRRFAERVAAPIGSHRASILTGLFAISNSFATFSRGIDNLSASSSVVGS
jgi:hypothetical protein